MGKLTTYIENQKIAPATTVKAATTNSAKAGKLTAYIEENGITPQPETVKKTTPPSPLMSALSNRTANPTTSAIKSTKGLTLPSANDRMKTGVLPTTEYKPINTNAQNTILKPTFGNRISNVLSGGVKSAAADYESGSGVIMAAKGGTEMTSIYDEQIAENQRDLEANKALLARTDLSDKQRAEIQDQIKVIEGRLSTYTKASTANKEVGTKLLDESTKTSQSAQQNITTAKQGLGKVGSTLVDLGVAGVQMGTDAVGSALTGGTVNPLTVTASRVFGSSAKTAIDNGATYDEAINRGALAAIATYSIGKLSSASTLAQKFAGQGATDTFTKSIIAKLADKLGKTAAGKAVITKTGNLLASGVGEGVEEMLEDAVAPVLDAITYQGAKGLSQYADADYYANMLYDGLIGGIMGSIAGGVDVVAKPVPKSNVTTPQTSTQNTKNDVDVPTQIAPNISTKVNTPTQNATQAPTIAPNLQRVVSPVSTENATQGNTKADAVKNSLNLPAGLGATSNSFVPEQKVSKVFSNTYQKTDSLTDEQKAQMQPEDYTYDVRGRKINEAASQQRVDVDYEGEVADLYSKQEWTDEDVYTSKKILDKVSSDAVKSGDFSELNKWTKAIQERGTRGGQTVEAFKAFQKTPEGAVIKAQQVIAEAEKKLTKKKELGKDTDTAKGRKVKAEAAEVANAVKGEATNVANEIAETIKKSTKKTASNKTADVKEKPGKGGRGVDTAIWADQMGDLLAEQLAKKLDAPEATTETPITKTILGDLVKFAEEHALPSRQIAPKLNRTAAARITDFFNNRTFYAKAWNDAQNAMREKYADNPAVLDQFDEWLNSTIGYNADGTNAVMQKAIMDAAIEGDVSLKQMRDNKALGIDNAVNSIYTKLAAEVKPEGADAITLKDAVTRFVNGKTADTNTDSRLESMINGALRDIGATLTENITKSATDKATLAKQVSDILISKYGVEADAAAKVSETVTEKFNEMLKERAIKKLFTIFKVSENSKSKASRLTVQQVEKLVNLGSFDVDSLSELVKAKYGIPTLTSADVRKIYELNKLAQETENDYQKRVYINRAARIIADKMPVTGKDKVLAVRRIAMLLNPKTLISRNAGGNAAFGLLEDIKDAPGTLVDVLVSKKTGQRTTSYNPLATSKAEFIGTKKGLTEWGKDIKNKVDTSPTEHEMPKSNALKSGVGSATENVLYKVLQLGDRPFYEAAKAKRLDELKRLGLDYTSEDAIAQANMYALERVFQNNSDLAKKAMQLRDSLGVIGDIAIPFAQTPANIFDKLADYSPIGYARAIKQAGSIGDSAWSQKRFVDTLSRSMTGTGIMTLAYFAAKAGLISGGEDESEDEGLTYQKKISGWQPYSIVVGDKSFTYDWATVVGALLTLGSDMSKSENAEETLGAILSAGAKAGINTMFNQSYLEGISGLFSSQGNVADGLENMLIGLPASFTPTAFQQIAKIIDPIARDTYDTDPFKKAWNKVKAKLPFLSQTLPAKINAAGQEITNFQGGKLSNVFESVLSPGFIGETQKTAIDTEVQRLYKATGDKAALPDWSEYTSKSDLSFSNAGESVTMSTKEWEQYQKTRGQYAYKELGALTKSADYKAMSDSEKVKAVSDIYSTATQNAKQTIVESRGEMYFPDTSAKAKYQEIASTGISQKQAYTVYKAFEALEPEAGASEVSVYQKISTISGFGYSDKQAIALAGTLYTTRDKDTGEIKKESLLPYLNTSKYLLSLYLTHKDSDYINMTVPETFTSDSVEYALTPSEKKLFKETYANYFNSYVNNVSSSDTVKTIRRKALDEAKEAVINDRNS